MSDLPAGWCATPIGGLCDLKNGRAFKPTEWSIAGLPIVRIQNLNNLNAPFNRYTGDFDPRHHLKGGELLFAWSGTPGTSFGAHVWRGGEALLNQHIFRVDFDERLIDKRFFRFAINQKLNELIDVAHGGVGLRHVTKGVFESTEVALPGRSEQQRIADKLDTVLARVDACRDRLARVAPLLKRFRQSVLAAAFSGRMEGDQASPRAYATQPLAELANMRLGKMLDKQKNTGSSVPYLGNINVRWFSFQLDELKSISVEAREREEFCLRNGDVLICEGGEPGRCAVWTAGSTNIVYQKALHRVRPNANKLLPLWLALYMRHCCDARLLDDLFTGSTIKHLTGVALAKLAVPVPSLETQAEVVGRVEAIFAFAERLEARLAQAQTSVDRLTPSLLAKAFRGELVSQDPADEPAAELLKRLAAQRDAAPVRPRGRRRAVPT